MNTATISDILHNFRDYSDRLESAPDMGENNALGKRNWKSNLPTQCSQRPVKFHVRKVKQTIAGDIIICINVMHVEPNLSPKSALKCVM